MRAALLLLVPLLLLPGCASGPGRADVAIQGSRFVPENITVAVGYPLLWRNDDPVGHTVTSVNGTELASPALGPGDPYRHTFTRPGTYAYLCQPHPWMRGNVTVTA